MAIKNTNVAKNTTTPVVCELSEFKGKQVLSLNTEGGNPSWALSGGIGKWAKLFTMDGDGDSNLMNVLSFVLSNVDHEEASQVLANVQAFIEAFQAQFGSNEELTEELAEEEALVGTTQLEEQRRHEMAQHMAANPVGPTPPAHVEEVEQAEEPSIEEGEKYLKRLRSETRIGRTATDRDVQLALVRDAWFMCSVSGMPWTEYRTALNSFANVHDYFAHVGIELE